MNFEPLRQIALCAFDQLEEEEFYKAAEEVWLLFLELAKLPYKDFARNYHELCNIVDNNQSLFIKIFIYIMVTYSPIASDCDTIESVRVYNWPPKLLPNQHKEFDYFLANCKELRFSNNYSDICSNTTQDDFQNIMDIIHGNLYRSSFVFGSDEVLVLVSMLSYARTASFRYGRIEEVYSLFCSISEKISFAGNPQLARDGMEELVFASYLDGIRYCGFISRLALYVSQRNIMESLVYACISLASIENLTIYKYYRNMLLLSIAKILRDSQATDLAIALFKHISEDEKFTAYDKQHALNSYFWCLLEHENENVITEIQKYLYMHLESILNHGEFVCKSWYSLLYSTIKIFPNTEKELNNFLIVFKRALSKETIALLEKTLGMGQIKNSLYYHLNTIHTSRNYTDITSHLKIATPVVNEALAESISRNDVELFIAAHYGKSLPFVIAKSYSAMDKRDITWGGLFDYENFIDNYIEKVINFANESKALLLVCNIGEEVYSLFLNKNIEYFSKHECTMSDIHYWVSSVMPNTYFDEYKGDGFKREHYSAFWREESDAFMLKLPNLKLDGFDNYTELFIMPSAELLSYPATLYQSKTGLLSKTHPVSTVFPISIFGKEPNKTWKNAAVDISVYDENNLAVQMALDSILSDLGAEIDHKSIEKLPDNTDISVYIGHGLRSDDKFLSLFAGENKFIFGHELARFCHSKIAIFFVCHAGFSNQKAFSVDAYSLANTLIRSGVEHVIAPAWPFYVRLAGPWLKNFLSAINTGKDINKSVFDANCALREIFKSESAWACMNHYQGNITTSD